MKEIIKLPEPRNEDVIARIIGKKGKNLRDLEKQAGIKPYDVTIKKDKNEVHIIGTEKQVNEAKRLLQDLISSPTTDCKTKITIPPGCKLGVVIGRKGSNLTQIEEKTGARVEVINDKLYVRGNDKQCKEAIIEVKNKMANVCNKKPLPRQYNFLHASEQCADYKLQEFDCPNPNWNGEKHFKVYRIEDDDKESLHTTPEDLNTEELQEFVRKVLKEVRQENKDKEIKADFFCHFGHLYIGNVDEGPDQEKTYKLSDLKAEFENGKKESWRLRFNAIEELEFKELEKQLQFYNDGYKCTVDPHIRHDFQFYTPSCTSIRAKIFMDMDGNIDPKFSHQDIDIRKHDPKQVSSASPAPKYMLCDQFLTRARVNIMILSEGMDCRLAIRTVSPIDDKGKTKEFEKNVSKYLDNVSIVNKELCMPGDSEMPGNSGDYCLYYWRKCHRRSYPYKADGEEFSITISEEDVMDVTGSGQQECKTVDIHLHCDEWDRLLTSGKWEPEQIVEKLPQFLNFVRDVQANISEPPDKKY
ncbi:uncharacterized protein LOC116295202 isoform X3 [Actinia tenebrosa]|uniref:Uncharacterized protein LOC116295202 isoform X3 n=1 Tax=Actinia tenebrosa TaxID=6105 RepID=A0A6P8I1R0_ACTTE|nr:uncharacterized protein LOC116295202 isoform X3 [Actinia tenebrosa]